MIPIIYLITGKLPLPEIHTIWRGAHIILGVCNAAQLADNLAPHP